MSQATTSQHVDNAAQPKPVKLNPPQFAKVGDLYPMQKEVNLVVRVVKLEAIASTNRNGAPVTVYECLLGDETGTIIFTARPNQLDLLKAGNLLVIRNAFVTIFKEYMRLRVDRWGSIRTYEDDASKVPADCQAPAINAAAFSVNEDKAKNVSLTAYERVDDKNDNNNNNNNGGDNNQGGNRRPRRNNNRRRGGNNNNNNGPRDGGDNNNSNNNNNNNGPRGRNNNRRNSNNNNDNNNQYDSPSRRPNNNNNRRQSGGNRNNNNNNNNNSNNNDNYKGGSRQGGNRDGQPRDDNNRDGQPRRNNNRPPRRNNNNNNNNSNTNANTNN